MKDALAAVSQRVRTWREQLGLSLHELADRSQVAASTIQKVETGQMVPSIAVLLKIARGLDRRPAELVSEEAEETNIILMRSKEHAVMSAGSQMRIERLSGDLFDPAVELWRAYLRPGVGSGRSQHAYEGEEVIVCEEGEVTFRFDDEDYRLTPGDTLHFKGGLPHQWWNSGSVPARFLMAGNFPKGLRRQLHGHIRQSGKSTSDPTGDAKPNAKTKSKRERST